MGCCSSALRSGEVHNGFDYKKEGRGTGSPIVRCAIYTRKSTEEGLDQEFNSLHAQRESGRSVHREPKRGRLEARSGPVRRWRVQRRKPGAARLTAAPRRRGRRAVWI